MLISRPRPWLSIFGLCCCLTLAQAPPALSAAEGSEVKAEVATVEEQPVCELSAAAEVEVAVPTGEQTLALLQALMGLQAAATVQVKVKVETEHGEMEASEAPTQYTDLPYQSAGMIGAASETACQELSNFCLGFEGDLYLCDEAAKAIRVVDVDDKLLALWQLDFHPTAIHQQPDGNFVVGGRDEVVLLAADGTELARRRLLDFAEQLPQPTISRYQLRKLRQKVYFQLDAATSSQHSSQNFLGLPSWGAEYGVHDAWNLPWDESLLLRPYRGLEVSLSDVMQPRLGPCTSIAGDAGHSFVALSSHNGYIVLRFNPSLQEAKIVMSKGRGCCGQFDISLVGGELVLAANARHQVQRFDRDGNVLGAFGKAGRTSTDPATFGGCCDPMNVTGSADGRIITSESSAGLIKSFAADGSEVQVLAHVAQRSGCKRVQVAMNQSAERLFVLDTGKKVIFRLDRQALEASLGETADSQP